MEQEDKNNNGDGFFIVDNGTLPVSNEGSLFIGWMEMRLKECIELEDYEKAEKLKRDIQKARENMVTINPSNDSEIIGTIKKIQNNK